MRVAGIDELCATVNVAYRIKLIQLCPTGEGADPNSRNFEGIDDRGSRFFLKQRGVAASGVSLSAWLVKIGIETVLAPIRTLSGDCAVPFGVGVIVVYPFVERAHAMDRPLNTKQWSELGLTVRQIHDSVIPRDVSHGLEVETYSVPGLEELGEAMDKLASRELEDEVELQLAVALAEHRDSIRQLLANTRDRGRQCQSQNWEFVPCHADLHAYNILVEPPGSLKIVDWDTPRLAPRECDLQFVCRGGIFGAHGAAEEAAFFEGYGSYYPNPLLLDYYRDARVLEDVVAYSAEALDSTVELERRFEAVRGLERCFR